MLFAAYYFAEIHFSYFLKMPTTYEHIYRIINTICNILILLTTHVLDTMHTLHMTQHNTLKHNETFTQNEINNYSIAKNIILKY